MSGEQSNNALQKHCTDKQCDEYKNPGTEYTLQLQRPLDIDERGSISSLHLISGMFLFSSSRADVHVAWTRHALELFRGFLTHVFESLSEAAKV